MSDVEIRRLERIVKKEGVGNAIGESIRWASHLARKGQTQNAASLLGMVLHYDPQEEAAQAYMYYQGLTTTKRGIAVSGLCVEDKFRDIEVIWAIHDFSEPHAYWWTLCQEQRVHYKGKHPILLTLPTYVTLCHRLFYLGTEAGTQTQVFKTKIWGRKQGTALGTRLRIRDVVEVSHLLENQGIVTFPSTKYGRVLWLDNAFTLAESTTTLPTTELNEDIFLGQMLGPHYRQAHIVIPGTTFKGKAHYSDAVYMKAMKERKRLPKLVYRGVIIKASERDLDQCGLWIGPCRDDLLISAEYKGEHSLGGRACGYIVNREVNLQEF